MLDLTKIKPISDEPFAFGPMQTKWLEALESGQWKQAPRALMRTFASPSGMTKSYCCLGVLCELAGLQWQQEKMDAIDYGFTYGGKMSNGFLPGSFHETIGLRSERGEFKAPVYLNGNAYNLAEMNDLLSLSFADIAAYIRHDPHNVFTHSA